MEKKKKNLWQFFQMLGKTFMFPIALLSVCGMLLGIGSAFTNSSLIEAIPFLENSILQNIFSFMTTLGLFAFNNLGVLFAMAIPLGLLKEEKELVHLLDWSVLWLCISVLTSILQLQINWLPQIK